jgi:hypothetical protein
VNADAVTAPNIVSADPDPSTINEDGVKTVVWNKGYGVAWLVTEDGETLYPTPAPSVWAYLSVVVFPVFGFLIPWGVVKAVGWVTVGFSQPRA